MRATVRAAICLVLACSLHARGDLVLVQKSEANGKVLTTTMKIKGGKARTDRTAEANPSIVTTTLIDFATGDRVTLDPASKQFTKQTTAQITAKREPSQPELPAPADTGNKEKIGDYEAEIYTTENAGIKFTYWIVKDYPYAAAVSAETNKVRAMETKYYHAPDLSKIDGVVVKMEVTIKAGPAPGNVLTVTLISAKTQPVDDSELQIPAGYKEVAPAPMPPPPQEFASPSPSPAAAPDTNALPTGIHLQSKYETLDSGYSITFTAPGAMLYEDHDQKITGKSMSPGFMGRDVLVFLEKPRIANTSYVLGFTRVADDILYDGQGTILATASTRDKAKTLLPDLLHRDQAEAIAASCRLYALNHDGKFPARIADVPPSYSPGGNIFAGQTPQKIIDDYDYLGAGATLDDAPAKLLLRSKYPTSDGGKVEVPIGTPQNVLLQTKYESVDGDYSITFTGLGSVLYEGHDRKTTGNCYMIHPPPGVSILVALDDKPTLRDFTFAAEGILYDGRTMIAVAPVKEKAKTLIPDFQHLMDAEFIADYCRSYASNHDGKYPAQLAELSSLTL